MSTNPGDQTVTELTALTTPDPADLLHIVDDVSGTPKNKKILVSDLIRAYTSPQTLTGAGAVDITSFTTLLVTTGADALTLADGAENQEKHIVMKTDGGAASLTPDNIANGTSIVFDDVGDSAHLIFSNSAWHFMGGTATLTGNAVLCNIVEDLTPQLGADLECQGNNLQSVGVVNMTEQANADADVDGEGQWWVRNNSPNVPMFTDDLGNDFDLTATTEINDLSAAVTWVNVPNTNITQGSVTQHQAALTIIESQITSAAFSNWNTAFGWGNHASGGYAPLASPNFTSRLLANSLGVPSYVTAGYTGNKITVATGEPGSPAKGDIWFDTS